MYIYSLKKDNPIIFCKIKKYDFYFLFFIQKLIYILPTFLKNKPIIFIININILFLYIFIFILFLNIFFIYLFSTYLWC